MRQILSDSLPLNFDHFWRTKFVVHLVVVGSTCGFSMGTQMGANSFCRQVRELEYRKNSNRREMC